MTSFKQFTEVTVAVTGTAWIGSGAGSVQSAIEKLLSKAEDEVLVAVYEITSGAEGFLKLLRASLARGVKVTIIINRYEEKSSFIKKHLEEIAQRFPHFEILNFKPERKTEDFHAKIIVVDRQDAIVGSANLTWNGLVGNHELAVVVSGKEAAIIAGLVDRLCADSRIERVSR